MPQFLGQLESLGQSPLTTSINGFLRVLWGWLHEQARKVWPIVKRTSNLTSLMTSKVFAPGPGAEYSGSEVARHLKAWAHPVQRHRVATRGVCVPGAPDVSTAYVICRAQWRMKMQGHLFKNLFKMSAEHETRRGVLLSIHEAGPARSTAPGQSGASRKFNVGREWGRGLLGRHSPKSVFTTYWILPSVTDMSFQWHPSWLCLATTNYAWVVYD